MQIQFLRNATLVVIAGERVILVDPMLGEPGTLLPFSLVRHRVARNPLVPLPRSAAPTLARVTHALITHCQRGHKDHLDAAGIALLNARGTPTFCRRGDEGFLRRRNVDARPLAVGKAQAFLDGRITPIPTRHGHGCVARLMGPGVGYLIELPHQPTLYIAGDTVLTDDVRRVLRDARPDVAVVAAGHASVDVGGAILMSLEELEEFFVLAPGKVVANHLEALNHCPVTRGQVRELAAAAGLAHKVAVPHDGDRLVFDR